MTMARPIKEIEKEILVAWRRYWLLRNTGHLTSKAWEALDRLERERIHVEHAKTKRIRNGERGGEGAVA